MDCVELQKMLGTTFKRSVHKYKDKSTEEGKWLSKFFGLSFLEPQEIRVITKLPNSEQSSKRKVKTHKYINRQNQSTTGKLGKP
jgi:hypothetical protein